MSPPPSASAPHILLVEDDDMIREALSAGLRQQGFRVRAVSDARSALEVLHREPIDVVVTDWRTPSDGGRVARDAWQRDPGLPVLVLSAEPPPADLPPGVRQWLQKPASIAELVRALRQLSPS